MPSDLLPNDEQSYGSPSDVPPPIPTAPTAPTAPPTQPGELVSPPRRSIWPIPVGIIAIVLSAVTTLSALMSVVMGMSGSMMASVPAGSEGEEMTQAFSEHGPFLIGAGVLLAIAAGLGVGGGIGLIMRKRWAVVVLFVFACWKLLAGAAHAVAYASWMSAMMDYTMQTMNQAGGGATPPGMASSMMWMMGAMKFVFGALFPVFILIWLSMPHIKKDYRGW